MRKFQDEKREKNSDEVNLDDAENRLRERRQRLYYLIP